MCMSKGAPKKPEYGPCQESHCSGTVNCYIDLNVTNTDTTTSASTGNVHWNTTDNSTASSYSV